MSKKEINKTTKQKAVKKVKKKAVISKSVNKENGARNKSVKKTKEANIEKIENNENENAYLANWTAPEFIKTRGEMLFYYASIVGSVLMMIWFFAQGSFIAVVTFIMVIVVVVFQIYRQPLDVECKIDLDGIILNERLYKYSEIDSFEVIQEDENNALKFKLKNAFLPVKEVQLEDQDPYYIRAALEHFLPEKKQKEMLINYEKKSKFGDEMSEEEFEEYLKEDSK